MAILLVFLSRQCYRCHIVNGLGKYYDGKKFSLALHLVEMDPDPDPP